MLPSSVFMTSDMLDIMANKMFVSDKSIQMISYDSREAVI